MSINDKNEHRAIGNEVLVSNEQITQHGVYLRKNVKVIRKRMLELLYDKIFSLSINFVLNFL